MALGLIVFTSKFLLVRLYCSLLFFTNATSWLGERASEDYLVFAAREIRECGTAHLFVDGIAKPLSLGGKE